jgi:hypothetical protein
MGVAEGGTAEEDMGVGMAAEDMAVGITTKLLALIL